MYKNWPEFFTSRRNMNRWFASTILGSLVRDLLLMVIAFALGTAVLVPVLWYYDLPLILSLAGGFAVLALIVVIRMDSSFF